MKSTTFKIGDIVECIEGIFPLTTGAIYKVTDSHRGKLTGDTFLQVSDLLRKNVASSWRESRFVKWQPSNIQRSLCVGDRVRFNPERYDQRDYYKDTDILELTDGRVLEITDIDRTDYWFSTKETDKISGGCSYELDSFDFELVERGENSEEDPTPVVCGGKGAASDTKAVDLLQVFKDLADEGYQVNITLSRPSDPLIKASVDPELEQDSGATWIPYGGEPFPTTTDAKARVRFRSGYETSDFKPLDSFIWSHDDGVCPHKLQIVAYQLAA